MSQESPRGQAGSRVGEAGEGVQLGHPAGVRHPGPTRQILTLGEETTSFADAVKTLASAFTHPEDIAYLLSQIPLLLTSGEGQAQTALRQARSTWHTIHPASLAWDQTPESFSVHITAPLKLLAAARQASGCRAEQRHPDTLRVHYQYFVPHSYK